MLRMSWCVREMCVWVSKACLGFVDTVRFVTNAGEVRRVGARRKRSRGLR